MAKKRKTSRPSVPKEGSKKASRGGNSKKPNSPVTMAPIKVGGTAKKTLLGPTSIIVVSNQKGGVGKTTTVINLAASWAAMGKKVLVIDSDFQANSTIGLSSAKLQKDGEKNLYFALKEIGNAETIEDIEEVIHKTKFDNIDIVPSCGRLSEIEESMGRSVWRDKWLEKLTSSKIIKNYDIVIVDTHPTLAGLFSGAIAGSHYYLVPCFPEEFSAIGLHKHMHAVEIIRSAHNRNLMCLGILISNIDPTNTGDLGSVQYIEDILKDTEIDIIDTYVPVSKAVRQSHRKGIPLLHYAPARKTPITMAYMNLAKQLSKELKGKRQGRSFRPVNYEQILENTQNYDGGLFEGGLEGEISLDGAVL